MCTLVLLRRPGHAWPLLLAANRDERLDRAWEAPAEFWPGITGGRDASGGGTWLALSRQGVVAGVLNRPGSLGPAPGKRSRGELPILALGETSAAEAAGRIATLDAGEYRPFNLVIADAETAWFLKGLGEGRPQAQPLGEGISMVTAHDPNDLDSPRTRRHLPRFRAATPPEPGTDDWSAWEALLRNAEGERGEQLCVPDLNGFGTVCSSLIALGAEAAPMWRFAARAGADFLPVPL
ncbi:MAG: NRDE family protein [Pseudomonadota bacterium]